MRRGGDSNDLKLADIAEVLRLYCLKHSTISADEAIKRIEDIVSSKSRRRLLVIEKIAREAFNDPDTQDINLYRAQKLADIFALFEYDGATINKEEV